MRDVYAIGVGIHRFGELWDMSLRDLFGAAALAALDDAGVEEVDAAVVGCMASGPFVGQDHLAPLCAEAIGLLPTPVIRVEAACGSGGLALRQGFVEVASGVSDVVLVAGVEKMTDVDGAAATDILATAADQEAEVFHGVSFPALNAMMARAHMERYGTTPEQLARVAVKNHENGVANPDAHFRMRIDVEQVLSAQRVAEPLGVLDCAPRSDGAACLVLCPAELARSAGRPVVRLAGTGYATDTLALHSRADLTTLASTTRAAAAAYGMAGISPPRIDVAELHDAFTITEIIALEALGLVDAGQGGPATERGETALDGRVPVNPSGGLKARGHPVGATGVAQAVEIVRQLRGEAGGRQVRDARVGLTHNVGGVGGTSFVHIFSAC